MRLLSEQRIGPGHTRYMYTNSPDSGQTSENEKDNDMTRPNTGITVVQKESLTSENFFTHVRRLGRDGKDLIDTLLVRLLETASPSGQEAPIAEILIPYIKRMGHKAHVDAKGNLIVRTTDATENITMFSSHMDTVHRTSDRLTLVATTGFKDPNLNDMIYAVTEEIKEEDGKKIPYWTRSVLGADDKIGIYIMMRLMYAKVPGLYIFHVEEESGGNGSSYIALKSPDVLKGVRRAIAFDRRGYDEIIGSQWNGACCSTEFQKALAEQLNARLPSNSMRKFVIDGQGSFTDTANYTSLVPECTNVAVGYFSQHSNQEHFDPIWLNNLLIPALCGVKWDELPTKRSTVPLKATRAGGASRSYNTAYSTAQGEWDECPFTGYFRRYSMYSDVQYKNAAEWSPGEPIPGTSDYTKAMAVEVAIATKMGLKGSAKYIVDLQEQVTMLRKMLSEVSAEKDTLAKTVTELKDVVEVLEMELAEYQPTDDDGVSTLSADLGADTQTIGNA